MIVTSRGVIGDCIEACNGRVGDADESLQAIESSGSHHKHGNHARRNSPAIVRTPYKGGIAADADRRMEEVGGRLVDGTFDLEDVKTIVEWKSPRRGGAGRMRADDEIWNCANFVLTPSGS